MVFNKPLLTLLLLLPLALGVHAQERPKIGLVLSGGGAKGAAHVGVLKVLEANRIPVDYIAGTSIGAYVGGMYALGYSAAEIESIMLNTDWDKGYSDTIPRQELSYRDKELRDQYNIPLNMGYSDGELKTPPGLLLGQSMSLLLRQSTNVVHEFKSFDHLAIPFRAVATNLANRDAVVLDRGSMVTAMQASANVPGALAPMLVNGKLLVDGGIANNMPVDVVKAMGADIVIAVNIGSPLVGKDELTSTVAVLNQLSTMLTAATTEEQLRLLSKKDILIRPAIDDLSTTDFSIMGKALVLGERAANEQLVALKKLSQPPEVFAAYQQHKQQVSSVWFDEMQHKLVEIVFDNDSHVSNNLIKDTFAIKDGEVVTVAKLSQGIDRVYALNRFERVNAEFQDTPKGRILVLTTKGKSWGPNYFNLGFDWEDDFKADTSVTLDAAYAMTNLNANNAEWRNELKLGSDKLLGTEFYQPLDQDQHFYGRAHYQYQIQAWDLFDDNNKVFELDKRTHQINLGLGLNFNSYGQIELGFTGQQGKVANEAVIGPDRNYNSYGGYLWVGYDTLNSISFPTSGNKASLQVFRRHDKYDIINSVRDVATQIKAEWKGALSLGSSAFVGKFAATTSDRDGISIHLAELGGFLNLSGYTRDSLVGAHKLFGALMYQHDLRKDALGVAAYPLYLGISLEAGNVWLEQKDVSLKDLIYAGSLYVGTDTAIGPAALAFGMTNDGQKSVYLYIGKSF